MSMSPISKINKSSTNREPKTRGQKQSAIAHHDDRYRKLEAEQAKLLEAQKQDMFTDDDDQRLKEIERALAGYDSAMAQANTNPGTVASPEAGATSDSDTVIQGTTTQDAMQQEATEPDTGGLDVTGQRATVNTPDPEPTHANILGALSKDRNVKREPREEPKASTNRLVDDLDMAWNVDVDDRHIEPSLQNHNREAFGHIMRNSQTRYCIRYGSADAYSARFESTLPAGSRYRETRDVTQRSNRIVERIVQHHKDNKLTLPMDILSKVKVLVVYWDSKMGVGHDAEVDVLAPDFAGRRPHTRCFVYLDPALYASTYDIENKTSYSHETRSTMKLLMEGNNDQQKSITFYNIAVRLENKFEEKCMSGAPDRPKPLRELVHERKAASRRSGSRYATAKPAVSPAPVKPPISPRRSAPPPNMRLKQTPARPQSRKSLRQRFHADFLELFDLPDDTTYTDLDKQQQLLYPAQFAN
ncbi:uncharacterized protein ALTATR162_LOCUS131 [Alternaria atra]|uniref:Uncharacterized protein n=1 Tax=Alternaria atra TaxID=119953 RepID=A0A8J2MZX8_9PLEO|nr:uncharacterized protein ALTATR162_LOCUS131 [Alternaria atra]CAG5137495.1 unnamed protein product [Alternaria atra]